MVTDPVSDLLVRIRTAGSVGKPSVSLPFSKLNEAISRVLLSDGYLRSVEVTEKPGDKKTSRFKYLELGLAYKNGDEKIGKKLPRVTKTARLSKPSRRMYLKKSEIKPVRQGFGHAILSTPKGIMDDKQARKENLGGEILFKIW